jgi:hypothetical protein
MQVVFKWSLSVWYGDKEREIWWLEICILASGEICHSWTDISDSAFLLKPLLTWRHTSTASWVLLSSYEQMLSSRDASKEDISRQKNMCTWKQNWSIQVYVKGHVTTSQNKSRCSPQEPNTSGDPQDQHWVALYADHPIINSLYDSQFY